MVTATVSVGLPTSDPRGVAVTPDSLFVYVVNTSDSAVVVIDARTNTLSTTVGVGSSPEAIAITPSVTLEVLGKSKKNSFLTETERLNSIQWMVPTAGTPVRYKLFRDSELIATFSASDPRIFEDHNRVRGRTYSYLVVAEAKEGTLAMGSIAITSK